MVRRTAPPRPRRRWRRAPGDAAWPSPTRRPRRPPVDLLLAVDREYRRRARLGELPRIVPRGFEANGGAWLPVLEVERDGWKLRALYSTSRRARELGRTRDWVVIDYRRPGVSGRCTVVTERGGRRRLHDLRVVRGREAECREYYAERRVA